MGSELCANGLEVEGIISSNSIAICGIPKVDSSIVEEKKVTRFPQSADLTFDQRPTSIGLPVTPDFDRAGAEQYIDMTCRVMLVSSPPGVPCFDFNDHSLKTPKESIFDPFAPVYDKFMLAPRCRKYREESRDNIARRLDFSSTTNMVSGSQEAYNDTISEEDQIFEIVYSDLLDFITSEWSREFASESMSHISDSDGFCTPKYAARLTGIAETCPGAPKKSINKYKNIDRKLCRKLEY